MVQKSWNGKIGIESLTDKIIEYLVKKDFEIIKTKILDGYQISASDSPFFSMISHVDIRIKGTNSGCVVSVESSSNVGNIGEVSRSVMLTTLFGGGYFLLRKLKSREAWIIFEREFWNYVDKTIRDLLLEHNP